MAEKYETDNFRCLIKINHYRDIGDIINENYLADDFYPIFFHKISYLQVDYLKKKYWKT